MFRFISKPAYWIVPLLIHSQLIRSSKNEGNLVLLICRNLLEIPFDNLLQSVEAELGCLIF